MHTAPGSGGPDRQLPGRWIHLLDLSPEMLSASLARAPGPAPAAFRARQIAEWVYRRGVASFQEMTDLPRPLREALGRRYRIYRSQVVREQRSADGTCKRLLRWDRGGATECVLIPAGERRTACLSTQVGCPVGCAFCASGLSGLERNLRAGEIVEQALRIRALCPAGRPLTHAVLMGLGEPLANYQATVQAVRILNASWGLGLGARRITVSTVGLPQQMRRLAGEGLQITLAVSLHAPDDRLRERLIPWAGRIRIEELIQAGRYYFDRTGREVTLEYILLGNVNDRPEHARQLARISRQMRSNVNLIPYNPVPELGFDRPATGAVQQFRAALHRAGISAHVRAPRGLDIDAACGQLRRRVNG